MNMFLLLGALSPLQLSALALLGLVPLILGPLILGAVFIRERQVGIIVKKFGPRSLPVTGSNGSTGLVDGLLGLGLKNNTPRHEERKAS